MSERTVYERMTDEGYTLQSTIRELTLERDRYRTALQEIVKCEGAFNRDPLTHAQNVIANLDNIARDALEGEKG